MISPFLIQVREKVIDWAAQHASVRAAIICGSTERQVKPADEWADLDFEIYVTDFSEFLSGMDWMENIAQVWTYLQLSEPEGPVFLVVYEGGEKVDFHFLLVDELEKLVATQKLPSAYLRGYRVVVDKDGLALKLSPPLKTPPSIPKPSAQEFNFQVRAFWFGALYVGKQILRRNLWVVKFRDWTMKENLLKILEWQAQSAQKWEIDTYNNGYHMQEWVDEQTWHELQQVFGHFDAEDSWRALFATLNLFRRLASSLADDLGYIYPVELDHKVTIQLEEIRKLEG